MNILFDTYWKSLIFGNNIFWSTMLWTWKKILIQFKEDMAINARDTNCWEAMKFFYYLPLKHGYINRIDHNKTSTIEAMIRNNYLHRNRPNTPGYKIFDHDELEAKLPTHFSKASWMVYLHLHETCRWIFKSWNMISAQSSRLSLTASLT